MPACLIVGGKMLSLAAAFTLSWVHSVEKTEWQENWQVTPQGLVLAEARVRGSGAGMEPGEGARLENGWWVWTPEMAPLPSLSLASSGVTGGGWILCHDGQCDVIGRQPGKPVTLRACGAGESG